MKKFSKVQIAAGLAVAVMSLGGGAVYAAPSLSQPGQEVEKKLSRPEAEVKDNTPEKPQGAPQVEFTISNFRLEAPDLYLDKGELTKILQDGMGEKKTMIQLNATLSALTRYCRQHGYPAAAAYVPAQESRDGMILIKVIPGRYGEIKIDNRSRLKERVAKGFINSLKSGDIIRTGRLETTLYSISDVSGTKAVGVLSPGKAFGTSDLTVRIEKGKGSNTVLYVENYGSKDTGQYRYGLQENIYDVSGNGDKISVGGLISNKDMHNYYANYETIIGRGGATLGFGYSRMDYEAGIGSMGLDGIAETASLFGHRSLYHLTNSGLTFRYGYDYRKLRDNNKQFAMDTRKHSHAGYLGLEGFERRKGSIVNYNARVTTGALVMDSDWAKKDYGETKGRYTKGEAGITAVERLGNRADVLIKANGQIASHNLDGSERMYLGGANGVRAYPQGEGAGDEGVLGTVETRFYTKAPGLVFSTYFDIGHVWFYNDGRTYRRMPGGVDSKGMTLKGYGVALSYTKPNDWFARLDYARRIGNDPNLSEKAQARGRAWFMLGKIW